MKFLLMLFTIFLSVNTFAQESEDDDNFDSVRPVYYLDSVYLEYVVKYNMVNIKAYRDIESMNDMLYEGFHIKVLSDEDISMQLSDTVSKLYKTSKPYKYNKQVKSMSEFFQTMAVDSNLNIFYVKVLAPCEPCKQSILDYLISDIDLITVLKEHKLKYLYINYYQTYRKKNSEFIVITYKHWFRRKVMLIIYNENTEND